MKTSFANILTFYYMLNYP